MTGIEGARITRSCKTSAASGVTLGAGCAIHRLVWYLGISYNHPVTSAYHVYRCKYHAAVTCDGLSCNSNVRKFTRSAPQRPLHSSLLHSGSPQEETCRHVSSCCKRLSSDWPCERRNPEKSSGIHAARTCSSVQMLAARVGACPHAGIRATRPSQKNFLARTASQPKSDIVSLIVCIHASPLMYMRTAVARSQVLSRHA